ncbi:MAG: c-type cytochrome [Planctomycetaceae bacterium]|nr:c-type cytochrome [Planctomycetales bacterium]MCB9875661.1 c-type cytochrome [Planctomycetaceae bacterium]MCB9941755.1 c-type cytochrome [Planctomycetaceae bacterium]
MRRSVVLLLSIGLSFFLLTASAVHAQNSAATPIDRISVADGFKVELLHTVPADQEGSWVNMTPDPQGRLIVSDQYGSLYRVTPGSDAAATTVEKLKVDIGEAHGLLCAFDSLYVMVNGNAAEGSGFYRVRDTDGDDQYDEVKLLRKMPGGGEHGPHAIVLSPDGKSLYVCAGNHTDLPNPEESRVPRNWQEDQLLPRMWDAGGHAVGKLAPGGWVCKTDPDGKTFELVGSGFRNEFDIAFNPDGELFTYDADMEWDIGSPWYRPTRVCHVTSGSEFGWRSGTGKWPAYYPDSLPAAVDIGPGSPTGIAFGTGAKFPAKYQKALFICDWSYGLLYAVHLEPNGSSYTGTFEQFATASPLPLTDVVVNPKDGAMYFTIGGRRTQSGLYRVTYVGDESTAMVSGVDASQQAQRELRAKLESFHGSANLDAIEVAWPQLSNPDRFIRYAARIAIEHQPVAQWQDRALAEKDPVASMTAMIALARCGEPSVQSGIIEALSRLDWNKLSQSEQLSLLRAYGLTFARLGPPNAKTRDEVLGRLDQHFPAKSRSLNRELAAVLVYLEAPQVAARTIKLLLASQTQEDQVQYALVLRTLKSGWTLDERRAYFNWFNTTGSFRGGHSFSGFVQNIRNEAIASLDEKEKAALADIINAKLEATDPNVTVAARPFVKKWEVADLLSAAEGTGRNFERGREMFGAAACFKCHRFAGEGGIIGPDLTGVGKRFNNQYLLESLIDPSKVISDQYQASIFVMNNGQTVIGKVANLNGDKLMVITNMLEPGAFTNVATGDIEEVQPSRVSMMPNGLLDTLSQEEILDLLAYLKSGGDASDPAFTQ